MLNCQLADFGGYSQAPPLHTSYMRVERQPGSAREYLHRQESIGPEHLARRHPEGGRSQHDLRLGPLLGQLLTERVSVSVPIQSL